MSMVAIWCVTMGKIRKNNLNGPGNVVFEGEWNDVYGRDNLLNGYRNGIWGD